MDNQHLISTTYLLLQQQMHAAGNYGRSGHKRATEVFPLLLERQPLGPEYVVLDYGCGKQTLAAAMSAIDPEMRVAGYDPALEGLTIVPEGPFDLIVCSDVLEHIEPDKIAAVLDHLCSLGPRLYVVAALEPASKNLPDGRNAHILLKPAAWWHGQFNGRGFHASVHASKGKEWVAYCTRSER